MIKNKNIDEKIYIFISLNQNFILHINIKFFKIIIFLTQSWKFIQKNKKTHHLLSYKYAVRYFACF